MLSILGVYEAVAWPSGLVLVDLTLSVALEVDDDAAVVVSFSREVVDGWYLVQVVSGVIQLQQKYTDMSAINELDIE